MKNAARLLLLCLSIMLSIAGCSKSESAINSFDDIKDKKIGVMTGSIGESLAKEKFPNAQVQSFDDVMDAVAAIKSGQLDAIITAYPTALQVSKKNAELRTLPEPLDNEDTAVAIKKGNDELLADVNRIIAGLKDDGTLESMKKRWLKADLSPYEERDIPLLKDGNVLKIGVSATREPLSFVDENGKVSGYDGELARIIGSKLKRPVEFSNMKYMSLIPALQSGKIDMIISGMNATEERKKAVNFSQVYFANSQVVIVKKALDANDKSSLPLASSSKISGDLADLQRTEGKRIGVMTGTTSEMTAVAKFPKADIKRFDDPTDAVAAMKSGQVDAVVNSYATAILVTKKHPELRQLSEPLFVEDIAIAMKKDSLTLMSEVNQIVAELKADGTLASMKKRWFKDEASPYEEINILSPQTGKPLKIGVSAILEPFIFVDGSGKISGHDVELARRIGTKLKRPVEFVDMKFMALIPALQSGKVDMIVSGMTATDERSKSVNFSQPYFSDAQVLLVKVKPLAPANTSTHSEEITKLRQIHGKRIAVLSGSAGDLAARKNFPDSIFQNLTASSDAALAVRTNKSDAFIYDKGVLLNLTKMNSDLMILEEPVDKLEVAAAVKKENATLLAEINGAINSLKNDGSLQRLREKWIESKNHTSARLPQQNNANTKGVLKMGTNAIIEPFSFQSKGKITGLDIELGQLIGNRLGKKVEIIDMHFDALIPTLQSGKIDFALSNFNVTEERKKLISFSVPYIVNDISALVRVGKSTDAVISQVRTDNTNDTTSSGSVVSHVDAAAKEPAAEIKPSSPSFLQGIADSFQSNIMAENRYLLIWDGLLVTVLISVLASIFGTILGALVCFMRMSKSAVLNLPAKAYISVLRGTPVLVLLMLIFYVVFASINISPELVAVIAFGMNFAAYAAEIFRSGIENVDKGQTEAGIAMGFTKVNTFLFIVLPQAVRQILPVYKGEFISLVKMTSIVGYIAVQDLTKASDIIRSRTFDAFFPLIMVAVLYFLISWLLTQSLEYLERATDPKRKRKQLSKV